MFYFQTINVGEKKLQVVQAITTRLNELCACDVEMEQISSTMFMCFSKLPDLVIFRAKLASSSDNEYTMQLVFSLEELATSNLSVMVQSQLLRGDATCSATVLIDSFDEPACPQLDFNRINVGVVAIIAVLTALAFGITVVLIVYSRSHSKSKSVRSPTPISESGLIEGQITESGLIQGHVTEFGFREEAAYVYEEFEATEFVLIEEQTEDHANEEQTEDHVSEEQTEDYVSEEQTEDHVSEEQAEDHVSEEQTEDHVSEEQTEYHVSEEQTEDNASEEQTEYVSEEPTEDNVSEVAT